MRYKCDKVPHSHVKYKRNGDRFMKYCFGVDIGGTTVKLGLFSEAGAIVESGRL